MAESKLQVVMTLRDEATAKLDRVQAKVESFGASFRRLSIGAAIGGAALTGAFTLAAWAAAEEEAGIIKLAKAVDNASKAVPVLGSRYDKLVEQGRAARRELSELEATVSRNRTALQRVAEAMTAGKATTDDYNLAIARLSESEAELAAQKELLSGITERQQAIQEEHTAALKKVKPVYAEVQEEIEKTIAALQRKTVFGDGPQREALAALVALTGDYDEAMKRLPIAMDLATAGGMDLVTAARLLGRVSEENITVLQRYGIEVKEGATATELLAAITQKFGGQAEEAAKSASGQMKQLQNVLGDLTEDIGAVMLPLIKELNAAIRPLLQDISEWMKANPELARGLILTGLALGAVLTALGAIGLVLPAIIAGFAAIGVVIGAISVPVAVIVAALAAFGLGIVLLIKDWDRISTRMLDDLKNWETGWLHFLQRIRLIINDFITLIEGVANAMADALNAVLERLGLPRIIGRITLDRMQNPAGVAQTEAEAFGLAEGGIVRRPTLALIGERGPEAVVPLGKGSGVTIIFNAPVYGMDSFRRAVTQAVRDAALGGAFRGVPIGGVT